MQPSPNFAYLAHHDPRLVALATQAEQFFATDPTVCLFKLRQFGEILAQRAAANVGLYVGPQEKQLDLINRLLRTPRRLYQPAQFYTGRPTFACRHQEARVAT